MSAVDSKNINAGGHEAGDAFGGGDGRTIGGNDFGASHGG